MYRIKYNTQYNCYTIQETKKLTNSPSLPSPHYTPSTHLEYAAEGARTEMLEYSVLAHVEHRGSVLVGVVDPTLDLVVNLLLGVVIVLSTLL